MTKQEFIDHADGVPIALRGIQLTAAPRLTREGGCEWKYTGTMFVDVGYETVKAQVSVILSVPGSKRWPKE